MNKDILMPPLDEKGQRAYELMQRTDKKYLFDVGYVEDEILVVLATFNARKNTVTFYVASRNGLLNKFLLQAIRHIMNTDAKPLEKDEAVPDEPEQNRS